MPYRLDRATGDSQERVLLRALSDEYERAPHDSGTDLIRTDGKVAIEFKSALSGVRDLRSALLRVAQSTQQQPRVEHAILVARVARLSAARGSMEFEQLRSLLRPDVAARIGLIAFADDGVVVAPDEPFMRALLEKAQPVFARTGSTPPRLPNTTWTNKTVEVWKTLFDAWLAGHGSMTIEGVMRDSEASYPTVAGVVTLLESYREVTRGSDRSVMFNGRPQRSLSEVLVVTRTMKRRAAFVDASGRTPDPSRLLRRVLVSTEPGVALGGITAARHYDRSFDLNGLPRVDVAVCARPAHHWDAWVRALGPTLRATAPDDPSALLVVHQLPRRALRTALAPVSPENEVVRFAEPSEVFLQLHDAGLHAQADGFVTERRAHGELREARKQRLAAGAQHREQDHE